MGQDLVLLLLGSNIEPQIHVKAALEDLDEIFEIRTRSHLYHGPTIGAQGSPDFVNVALIIVSPPPPERLRAQLREIEAAHGRVRGDDRNQPRTLDIDIVCYASSNGQMREPVDAGLSSLHYVALPALDIAGHWQFPGSDRRISDIVEELGPPPPRFGRMEKSLPERELKN
ncbi:MAG TPA: 2-amino-4-hydroxy-6-hydroxymethyldihydropteridine diphosphokinase [Planctomycetes bacterium]|nr:2-amino-4-hydroxy-6-hydroxymethyldihydropteridine diphosphokinase [Planctomycetota bacterium]HIN80097.1 2-amino-4-hydroxy-6-hydroxymethyldihydropteridine diphosphokinase [Planctomycetota bacterium]